MNLCVMMGENGVTEVGNYLMCIFWGDSKITADGDCSHEIFIKDACSLEEKLWPT